MRATPAWLVLSSLLCLTALPAQDKKPQKPKPATKNAKDAPKDDDTTKKDAVVQALDKFLAKNKVDQGDKGWREKLTRPPQQTFDGKRQYLWHLQTSEGPITLELFADTAPMHVTSVIYLTRAGFYDGLTFHRVIEGFMAQGGCPKGDGTGGPGYQMDGEFGGERKHDGSGILSTANAGPGTDGSQFFITFATADHLDGKHTIVGKVTDGMDAVGGLEKQAGDGPDNKPKKPLRIERAWIQVKVAGK